MPIRELFDFFGLDNNKNYAFLLNGKYICMSEYQYRHLIYRLLSLLSNNYFRFEYRLKVKADAACQIQIFNGYTKKDR